MVAILCVGETMAVFTPVEAGPPEEVRTWVRGIGGAESNVACALAALGVRVGWASAVGDDPFGRAVLTSVAEAGVDVSRVVVDPTRPTGLYVKEAGKAGSAVRYYRAGSAASALGPEVVDRLGLDEVSHVHLTGITAALSPSCLALVRALLDHPGVTTSFDVNWRPALWGATGPEVLRALAAEADVVLVGGDEAEALWGVSEPVAVREVLPEPGTLVVKQGAVGATVLEAGRAPVFEPALAVDVVEPVGAGDAFAAGFLAAHRSGEPPARRLRSGHLAAAGALCTMSDVAVPLPPADVARLLVADAATWAAARVGAAGVR
ncbi:2-dehydro-3-deoxygluconokinase [Saccharothrix longispora]|uniref:2-dehydro-3-deoxygluconokinase n=1 Tax=Saccharothrix longispora TaxID=33920 RepID=A0ABU1PPG9_9PSEU|nr:2-dehydro-3-deoxygluconokinase [Saccharothrix longispora]